MLDVIAPPYTSDFVQLFLPILENDSIAGTIRTEGEHDPVAEFIGKWRVNICKSIHSAEFAVSWWSQCFCVQQTSFASTQKIRKWFSCMKSETRTQNNIYRCVFKFVNFLLKHKTVGHFRLFFSSLQVKLHHDKLMPRGHWKCSRKTWQKICYLHDNQTPSLMLKHIAWIRTSVWPSERFVSIEATKRQMSLSCTVIGQ